MTKTAPLLRQEFDRSFVEAPAAVAGTPENLVAIRVAGQPCLLRLSQMSSLHAKPAIVRVPSSVPEFLGLTGVRAVLVPVYDLRLLLGHRASSAAPEWLVMARAEHPLGLAFDQFEEHLRLPSHELPPATAPVQGHTQGTLRAGDTVRSLIHIPSLIETLVRRTKQQASPKEFLDHA